MVYVFLFIEAAVILYLGLPNIDIDKDEATILPSNLNG